MIVTRDDARFSDSELKDFGAYPFEERRCKKKFAYLKCYGQIFLSKFSNTNLSNMHLEYVCC